MNMNKEIMILNGDKEQRTETMMNTNKEIMILNGVIGVTCLIMAYSTIGNLVPFLVLIGVLNLGMIAVVYMNEKDKNLFYVNTVNEKDMPNPLNFKNFCTEESIEEYAKENPIDWSDIENEIHTDKFKRQYPNISNAPNPTDVVRRIRSIIG